MVLHKKQWWELQLRCWPAIYWDCTGTSPHVHHKNISHFGSLREFERLKKVCIQPEALLGGCFGEPKAPFRLKNTLPASLESLTFYGSNGLILDLGLAEQFREILLSGDFIHLKYTIVCFQAQPSRKGNMQGGKSHFPRAERPPLP